MTLMFRKCLHFILLHSLFFSNIEIIRLEALEDKHVDSLSETFSSDEEESNVSFKILKRDESRAEEPVNSASWCSIS